MKKIVCLFSLFCLYAMLSYGQEKIIPVEQLPAHAKHLTALYFPAVDISSVVLESANPPVYKVSLINGATITYDQLGEWLGAEVKENHVPFSMIPPPIYEYVLQHHPEIDIVKIRRNPQLYEVLLSNNTELKFDSDYRLYEVDK